MFALCWRNLNYEVLYKKILINVKQTKSVFPANNHDYWFDSSFASSFPSENANLVSTNKITRQQQYCCNIYWYLCLCHKNVYSTACSVGV